MRVDPEAAFPKFVFYYLFSSKGIDRFCLIFENLQSVQISRNFLLKVEIPIPPLTEQEQIASELEHHLSVKKIHNISTIRNYNLTTEKQHVTICFTQHKHVKKQ